MAQKGASVNVYCAVNVLNLTGYKRTIPPLCLKEKLMNIARRLTVNYQSKYIIVFFLFLFIGNRTLGLKIDTLDINYFLKAGLA